MSHSASAPKPTPSHPLDDYLACRDCDLLYRVQSLPNHRVARCHRCGSSLYMGGALPTESLLAWTVTAMILLIIANSYPIMELKVAGRVAETSFLQAVMSFADHGMWMLALVVFMASIALPLLRLIFLLVTLLAARRDRFTPGKTSFWLRMEAHMAPWSMLEIYLLGLLVSLVKLKDIAQVVPGIAFYAFCLLIFAMTMTATLLDRLKLWRLMDRVPNGEAE